MINIISKAYCRHVQSGPKKVVDNLVKGLTRIGYPFVVNKRLDACDRLWIHDDMEAVRAAVSLPASIKAIIGPNLVVLPKNLPTDVDVSRFVYIHPSEWAKQFWLDCGFTQCPIAAWPTGIDTDAFIPSTGRKDIVTIYFKQRFPEELAQVVATFEQMQIRYEILRYPEYTEKQYKKLLARSRYIVWLGRQESQGIALQEALSSGVPILLCDVTRMGHWLASKAEMAVFSPAENNHAATSAEYFDDTCGIRITDLRQLPVALADMEAHFAQFTPRAYILHNLSLARQAEQFVALYETFFGLTAAQGFQGQLHHVTGNWVNRDIRHQIIFFAKDVAKIGVRTLKRLRIV